MLPLIAKAETITMTTITSTDGHKRHTKQSSKNHTENCLCYVETPIPESFLRQSVPIKVRVAVEKLKEKNFREEQEGRIKDQLERESNLLFKQLYHGTREVSKHSCQANMQKPHKSIDCII